MSQVITETSGSIVVASSVQVATSLTSRTDYYPFNMQFYALSKAELSFNGSEVVILSAIINGNRISFGEQGLIPGGSFPSVVKTDISRFLKNGGNTIGLEVQGTLITFIPGIAGNYSATLNWIGSVIQITPPPQPPPIEDGTKPDPNKQDQPPGEPPTFKEATDAIIAILVIVTIFVVTIFVIRRVGPRKPKEKFERATRQVIEVRRPPVGEK